METLDRQEEQEEELSVREANSQTRHTRHCSFCLERTGKILRNCLLIASAFALHKYSKGIRATVKQDMRKEYFGSYTGAATVTGLFDTGNILLRWLFAPLLAGLGDYVGRRPILLYATFVEIFPNVVLAVGGSYYWYMVIDALPTLTGTGWAYMADSTSHSSRFLRTLVFGCLDASDSLGLMVGYFSNILLVKYLHWSNSVICWIAVGISLLAMIAVLLADESLTVANRTKEFDWKKSNPLGAAKILAKYWSVLGCYFIMYMLMQFSYVGGDEVADDYNAEFFNVTKTRYNVYNIYASSLVVGCETVLAFGVAKVLNGPTTVLFGIALVTASYFVTAFISSLWEVYVLTAVNAFGQVWRPAFSEIVTAHVAGSEQGAVQGAIQSVSALATYAAPTIFTRILYGTYKQWKGCVWFIAGIVTACGLVAVLIHTLHKTILKTVFSTADKNQNINTIHCSNPDQDPEQHQANTPEILHEGADEDEETQLTLVSTSTATQDAHQSAKLRHNVAVFWFGFLVLFVIGNTIAGLLLIFIYPLKHDD
eukprot:TRINITY_DN76200_c0_g1_i1.p1 TRINITY_DN76200_c0_g1~~TRINITY_DN76200_c0_g1_i1.p1  ORF type:complete len:539 (+),score=50.35 TRINITY_DN76200_c0_g1_i1:22-1638(+)